LPIVKIHGGFSKICKFGGSVQRDGQAHEVLHSRDVRDSLGCGEYEEPMQQSIAMFPLLPLLAAALCSPAALAAVEPVLIEKVPHIRQKPDFCGEACAAMALAKLGHPVDQDFVFDASGLDPLLGRGCHTAELDRALRRIGFQTGKVWRTARASHADADLAAEWESLRADLELGIPSIICMRYSAAPDATEHFRLVLGHDPAKDEVLYHEPAEDSGAYRRMSRRQFLELWPLKYDAERWTVIRLRLEPASIETKPSPNGFTRADFAQHVMKLKKKLPGEGFAMVISPPFVVIGDEPAETVRRRAKQTVEWAVTKLKDAYFTKDPDEILDIWLFKDKESYTSTATRLFGRAPTTPFGFFSAEDHALVMNIATGGGTLVHEIVHPFIRANFPDCPSWFNEGLASLYEQSAEREGRIVGLTNWRLEGLKKAVQARTLPTFEHLAATSSDGFYRSDRGDNYAQARYLCYYLQEMGLLGKFYGEFAKSSREDPTGYKSLQHVLGKNEADMPGFEAAWRRFVLELTFP